MTPQPTPLQGQGQTSANFSASLEWTLRDIRSSYISVLFIFHIKLNILQFTIFYFNNSHLVQKGSMKYLP